MSLSTGQTLNNRYRIVRLLGQGGFGALYRAWDIERNAPCAVKEILDTSPAAQKQFLREAALLFNLSHPNLPKVYDAFSLPGGQYLVMDFIEGDDLRNLLAKNNAPFSEAQALPWLDQVCDVLTYLHSQNPAVIHRDLKPANIRITPQGQAVVVDFGITKVYDPKQRATLDVQAVTPGFAPPEQYGAEITDIRGDVYALGATAYALLTGKEPLPSINILMGQEDAPPPAHLANPQVSAHVGAAIEQAMALDLDRRPGSVAEFKRALHTPLAAPAQKGKTPAVGKMPSISPLVWAGAAGLLAVVILAVILLVILGGSDEPDGDATFTVTAVALQDTAIATEAISTPTEMAATLTPILAPSVTSSPLPTATFTALPPSLEPSPTIPQASDTPAPANGEIMLLNWGMFEFEEWKTGCPLPPGGPCWTGKNSRQAGDSTPFTLRLYGLDEILLKDEWENPTLVFWHRYVTRPDSYAVASILLGSAEMFLKQYTGSNGEGCYDALDLSQYKGRLVKGLFYAKALTASLDKPYSVEWMIQDVRLFPEFEREMLEGVEWCK